MILLGLETSTLDGSLALQELNGSQLNTIYEKTWNRKKTPSIGSHSEVVHFEIDAALKSCQLNFKDLDLLCTTRGPGSFTGIRVGIGAIKTLAYALNLPVFAPNSLELLAFPRTQEGDFCLTLLNAYKNQCYTAVYKANKADHSKNEYLQAITTPCSLTLPEIEKLALSYPKNTLVELGDGLQVYNSSWSSTFKNHFFSKQPDLAPKASTFGLILKDFDLEKQFLKWNQIVPLYIRASEAEEKLWQGLLKPQPKL